MLKIHLALACATAFVVAVPSTASAAETVKLDLSNPANEVASGVAAQSSPLAAGQPYVVRISGSGSLWSPVDTPGPVTCGTPDTKPIVEPTPGAPAAVATIDPALVFAAPVGVFFYGDGACVGANPKAPPYASGLMMGTKGVLAPAVPVGGTPTTPNPTHTYLYEVTGDGTPLQFQVSDVRADDNSGIFTIDVLTRAECTAQKCLPTVVPPTTPTTDPTACVAKSDLSIRLLFKKGLLASKASFWVNKKSRGTVNKSKLYAADGSTRVLTFKGLPAGTITLTVTIKLSDRTTRKLTKIFQRCTPKDDAPAPLAVT